MKDLVLATKNIEDLGGIIYGTQQTKEQTKSTIESRLSNAVKFKLKHGYSLTRQKLMDKYNCKTNEEYIALKKLKSLETKLKEVKPKK